MAVKGATAEGCNAEGCNAEGWLQVTSARHCMAFCELAGPLMQETSVTSPQEIASQPTKLGLSSEESNSYAEDKDKGLCTAAVRGHLDVVEYLVKCKADVDARDEVK